MISLKKRRRQRIRSRPFPESWREVLSQNVPYYLRLRSEQRSHLESDIQVFIAEKNFEGCGGLEMTDEIRVVVAAYACILLLGRQHDYYPRLESILVYPDEYKAQTVRPGPNNTVLEGWENRHGESWETGAVVLAWNPIRHRSSDPVTGHNVVLHEFAHQLDQEDGSANGAPLLSRSRRSTTWARTLGDEYEALMRDAENGQPTVLDKYGATNPAEFFAVATECFFERPRELRKRHAELYRELKEFYQQDPAALEDVDPVVQ